MIISKLNNKMISEDDIIFLTKASKYFNINSPIHIKWNNSDETYPDIWITLKKPYTIYITNEWRKQELKERHKRLIHELYHIIYRDHWKESKKILKKDLLKFWNKNTLPSELKPYLNNNQIELLYSTRPKFDSFSWYLYYCYVYNKDYKSLFRLPNEQITLMPILLGILLFTIFLI